VFEPELPFLGVSANLSAGFLVIVPFPPLSVALCSGFVFVWAAAFLFFEPATILGGL